MQLSDRELEALAMRLGRALLVHGWRVATAESCTGGWIAKTITDVAGSSQWFDSGVVTYSNVAKERLGVPHGLIEAHGAVSEPVARAMADAVRALTGVELAVAVTGIAGPGGGSPEKPVGTVWFAWSSAQGTTAERRELAGDREAIRRHTVAYALERLLAHVWSDDGAATAASVRTDGCFPDIAPQRRLFFALWPDAATTASVYHATRDVVRLAGGRATAKERLHVTVAFLGEVDEAELKQACSAVPAIKSPGAFDLPLDELGYWRESKILWLGPRVVPTPVKELEGRLWKRLIERGFKREPRDYRPHMTLARRAQAVEPAPMAAVRWRVEELVLVESLSRGRNVHYEVLQRWPL